MCGLPLWNQIGPEATIEGACDRKISICFMKVSHVSQLENGPTADRAHVHFVRRVLLILLQKKYLTLESQ